MKSRYYIHVIIFCLMLLSALPYNAQEWQCEIQEMDSRAYHSQKVRWGNEETGPWVDRVVIEIFDDELQMLNALFDGEIDACMDAQTSIYDWFPIEIEEIEFTRIPKSCYGLLNINCEKYPLNITGFRRALAFALEKEDLPNVIFLGFIQPHDSCVPAVNHMSIENQMNGLYYEADLATACELLDDAGFVDIDNDGFREAPNGSDFEILVYDWYQDVHSHFLCSFVVYTLHSMSIKAELVESPRNLKNGFQFCQDYDIAFDVQSVSSFALDELFAEFLSMNLDNPHRNLPRFVNSTYDALTNHLLHSTDYDEVREVASALQEIILYECPIIICYEFYDVYGYRTDDFNYDTDYIAADFWRTCYSAYRKDDDVLSGTFRFGTTKSLDSINLFETPKKDWNLLSLSYDSLFRVEADGKLTPRIAYDYEFYTHSDDSNISPGHCRCRIRIPKLWCWSDGTELTAIEVAQVLNYYREFDCGWFSDDLEEISAIYSLNSVDLILEFNTESYWHLYNIATKPIIPIHYFQAEGIEDVSSFDLHPAELHDLPVCGPFLFSAWVKDVFLEFEQNPNSPYCPRLYSGSRSWMLKLPPDELYSVISPSPLWESYWSDNEFGYSAGARWIMEYQAYLNSTSFVGPNPTHLLNPTSDEYDRMLIQLDDLAPGIYNVTMVTTSFFHESFTSTVFVKVYTEEEIAAIKEEASVKAFLEIASIIIQTSIVSFISTVIVGIAILKSTDSLQHNQKSLETHSHS